MTQRSFGLFLFFVSPFICQAYYEMGVHLGWSERTQFIVILMIFLGLLGLATTLVAKGLFK